jgi:hypothetical protein
MHHSTTTNALGCCWNHCTTMALTSLPDQNLWPVSAFLRGWTHGSQMVTGLSYMKDGPTFQQMEHRMSWTAQATWGKGIVLQHDDTPYEHAGTLSVVDGMHFHTQYTFFHKFQLVNKPWHQRTEWQHVDPVWMDLHLEHWHLTVTLFPFALMCPFWCTPCNQLWMCHTHSHMTTCDWVYSLAVSWMGFIWTVLILLKCVSFILTLFYGVILEDTGHIFHNPQVGMIQRCSLHMDLFIQKCGFTLLSPCSEITMGLSWEYMVLVFDIYQSSGPQF